MELEEARKILNFLIWKLEKPPANTIATTNNNEINAIRTLLNHLTKQEKMIELMAEKVSHMVFIDDNHKVCMFANKEEAKQYFEKKAGE